LYVLLLALAACTNDRTRRGYLETIAASYAAPPPRPVIIIPGFGVTRLYDPVAKRFVWGTPKSAVHTKYEDDLDLPPGGHDRLVPRGFAGSRGPINVAWHFQEALRRYAGYTPGVNAIAFEYDWRLSARENARILGALVERVRNGGRVDLLTHSAGALIALAYVKLEGGGAHVAHLVMVAPTQRGVVDAFRVFVHPERFIRRTFAPEMVATWPSVPEIFPEDGKVFVDEEGKTLDRDLWKSNAPLVRAARRFRDELNAAELNVDTHAIAGDCVPTARRVLTRRDGTYAFYPSELRPGEKGLAPVLFEPGDGTVPVSSATAGGDALIVCDGHQGIAQDPTVQRAIIRILRELGP
jgi:pimeloyl-ACP methyl ester carboxylesterase